MGVALGEGVAGTGDGDAVAGAVREGCAAAVEVGLAVAAEPHAATDTANTYGIATLRIIQVRSNDPSLPRRLTLAPSAPVTDEMPWPTHVARAAVPNASPLARARPCEDATKGPTRASPRDQLADHRAIHSGRHLHRAADYQMAIRVTRLNNR